MDQQTETATCHQGYDCETFKDNPFPIGSKEYMIWRRGYDVVIRENANYPTDDHPDDNSIELR